jgi:imidazole glycerol-phosphate synthase subunit HisF
MLMKRVIACLDVRDGRVAKGVRFESLREVGDPVELAVRYEGDGADEIVFLDIAAAQDGRSTLLDVVKRTADRLFIPLTVGGGINTVSGVGAVLRAGADKVSINSAAVCTPELIDESAARFGSQCIVASIDAKRDGPRWRVFVRGGREATALDAVVWARECAARGAGEIMLTSIDRDGTRAGYALDLTDAIASAVTIPVIASGGAGGAFDVRDVLLGTKAEAALVAGILHDGVATLPEIKRCLTEADVPVRLVA